VQFRSEVYPGHSALLSVLRKELVWLACAQSIDDLYKYTYIPYRVDELLRGWPLGWEDGSWLSRTLSSTRRWVNAVRGGKVPGQLLQLPP
jgi:hypothetical protein